MDEIVCEGTVYPLKYVGYEGRVKLIVPSKLNNLVCKSQVWPLYAEIIYTTANMPE
jgi:hypothetical protein